MKSALVCATIVAALLPSLSAQEPSTSVTVAGLASPLTIRNTADGIRSVGGELQIRSAGHTNLFNPPSGSTPVDSAPMALFTPDADFVLVAKATAELKAVYDVAALVLYEDGQTWAKLCYEMSPEKRATVVSVVNRGVSDDTNSFAVEEGFVHLAIARKGSEFSFHASKDGKTWTLIRHFQLVTKGNLRAGFAVHGSVGDGIAGSFTEIRYMSRAPAKMRAFAFPQ